MNRAIVQGQLLLLALQHVDGLEQVQVVRQGFGGDCGRIALLDRQDVVLEGLLAVVVVVILDCSLVGQGSPLPAPLDFVQTPPVAGLRLEMDTQSIGTVVEAGPAPSPFSERLQGSGRGTSGCRTRCTGPGSR